MHHKVGKATAGLALRAGNMEQTPHKLVHRPLCFLLPQCPQASSFPFCPPSPGALPGSVPSPFHPHSLGAWALPRQPPPGFCDASWPVLCFLSQTALSCLDGLGKHIFKDSSGQPGRSSRQSQLIPRDGEGSPSLPNLRPLRGPHGTEGATWLLSASPRSHPAPGHLRRSRAKAGPLLFVHSGPLGTFQAWL